ncbi:MULTISPECIES: helix-turn-helix domain-containing protein [Exiguobacterium]|uniref:helix-turn-helix domain-containing protein n=1 Tax=Exiguobacterium TaxID=33986 RepID=UPI0025B84A9F|nr:MULTISPECIES: helix-turn-helix transcriptional regulator [Exiguobacterium]
MFKKYADIVGNDHVEKLQQQGYIAAQIKKQRRQLNISQQELADRIGKPKSTIGRIEAGLTIPRADTLYSLSKALNIPLIIDGTNQNSPQNYSKV